jgi:hypothetical protein
MVNNIEKMICTVRTEAKPTGKAFVPVGTEASPHWRKRSTGKISYGFYQFYLHI